MNQQDELGVRIAKLLDEGVEDVSPEVRERLSAARRVALSPRNVAEPALVPALAGGLSRLTEQSVLGVRYLIPMAALVLGLSGVVYMHGGSVASEIADIDAGLLTDELPLDAYLDQGFDSWLKRYSR